jgi:hypothetical protein
LRVCGTQPILGAMDSMAAHNYGYSPRCSRTMRTARPRTYGENLFDLLFMALSSQRVVPPQNTGRFTQLKTGEGQPSSAQKYSKPEDLAPFLFVNPTAQTNSNLSRRLHFPDESSSLAQYSA